MDDDCIILQMFLLPMILVLPEEVTAFLFDVSPLFLLLSMEFPQRKLGTIMDPELLYVKATLLE